VFTVDREGLTLFMPTSLQGQADTGKC